MAVNVFKKIKCCKVAPLYVPDDNDGLKQQRCPEDLFRARRGYEQCKLNFLTTVLETLDGQTPRSGLFKKQICDQVKATKTDKDIVVKKRLEMDRNCYVSVGKKGKPRKFRPRKILRKLAGNRDNKVQVAALNVSKNLPTSTSGTKHVYMNREKRKGKRKKKETEKNNKEG